MNLKKVFLSIGIIITIMGTAAGYAYLSAFPGESNITLKEAVGDEPVNYLIMGSDSRGEARARADTLVIFRVDPKKNINYLISVPRDLRVDVPGHGLSKINSATAYGGPKLMIKTIEDFTGFKINHYALLNFEGFKDIIDALGGIEINVPEAINSSEPGYEMNIQKGPQVLTGSEALNYVRFRHDAQGDLGRIKRQQLFFKALSSELVSFRTIPKIPSLVNIFANNTESDLSSTQMISLALALRSVNRDSQSSVTLPGTGAMIGGVSYLIPEQEKIDSILADIKAGRKIDQEKESIKIEVLNGNGAYLGAVKTKKLLESKGFNVSWTGNAANKNDGKTIVYGRPGKQSMAQKVASALANAEVKLSASVFTSQYVDIIVVTGSN